MVIRPFDDPTWCAQSVVADLRPLCLGYFWELWWAHSVARPWAPISAPLTYVVYLLPFFSYLAGAKSLSARPSAHPSDPDAMTNTALEAIASSSGKNAFDFRFKILCDILWCVRLRREIIRIEFSRELLRVETRSRSCFSTAAFLLLNSFHVLNY